MCELIKPTPPFLLMQKSEGVIIRTSIRNSPIMPSILQNLLDLDNSMRAYCPVELSGSPFKTVLVTFAPYIIYGAINISCLIGSR